MIGLAEIVYCRLERIMKKFTAGLLNETMSLKAETKFRLGPTKEKSAPAMKRNCTCLVDLELRANMLEVIDAIGQESKAPEVRQLLLHHVELLIEQDRQSIHQSVQVLQKKLILKRIEKI